MKDVKGVIFDIDGVLVYQGKVYPGAVETVEHLREDGFVLRFLTNSTLKSRASAAEKLQKQGFNVSRDEVITASYASAVYLRSQNPRSCWVMLEREGVDEFRDFVQDQENPQYIVIGDNRSNFDFDHLNKALRLLLKGAKLIGMTPELIDSSFGEAELNVGAWVKMLEMASGVEAVYVGKPSPYVFEMTLQSMNLPKEQVIMVGDRVSSDVVGARNAGIRSVLLRTGEFDPKHLDGEVKPDFILDSIKDLLGLLKA